jgi:histidyl-tRNA synthetase
MKKNWVIDQVRSVYETYGFEPLDTPAFEYLEMFQIKSGDDIIDQIYTFKDKSDRELALRFELTASTVRVVASHRDLVLPFKRYAIGPNWRYERPSELRFREFWQADIDIFGVESSMADAEVLSAVVTAFERLGFEDFIIKINDRRILSSLVKLVGIPENKSLDAIRAVDKLGKIGREEVIKELQNISSTQDANKLLDLISLKGKPEMVLSQAKCMLQDFPKGIKGCEALKDLYEYSIGFGFSDFIMIDLSLARGLDYYTGPVYEVLAKGYEKFGSIAGGGRYDEIVELFGGPKTYATGISFGIDRVTPILDEKGAFDQITLGVKVYVAPVNQEVLIDALKITQILRKNKISSIVDMMGRRLGKQFEYANKKKIPKVLIVGKRELADESVTIRDMETGKQTKVKINELPEALR